MTSKKHLFLKFAMVFSALLVAAGIAELFLRTFLPQRTGPVDFIFDPVRGTIPVPFQCGTTEFPGIYKYDHCNNSIGLRGKKEYPINKSSFRILFLGDSFTYGTGVNDDQTFSALLQTSLDASTKSAEVINAGIGNTGTDYTLKFFLAAGSAYKPDITAVFFFENDFYDNDRGTFFKIEDDGSLSPKSLENSITARKSIFNNPAYNWLVSHSHLANLLKGVAVRIFVKHYSTPMDISMSDAQKKFAPEIKKTTGTYILALRNEVIKSGSKIIFYYIPTAQDLTKYILNGKVSEQENFLKEFLDENNIPFFSATPILAASGKPVAELYYETEGHWRPLAHRVFADFLGSYFAKQLP